MSLWKLKTVSPAFDYTLWGGIVPTYHYNDYLVTPPRIYQEELRSSDPVSHFFYEPSNDYLVLFVWFNTYAYPGWKFHRLTFAAATGDLVEDVSVSWAAVWTNAGSVGSYNKIYATMNSSTKIYEVSWKTAAPPTGAWYIDPAAWSPSTIFARAVVNREDNLIAGIGTWDLDIWDISGTPAKQASMRLPQAGNVSGAYMTYEDRKRLWIVTPSGLLLKANYAVPRWEILSSVDTPGEDDIGYAIAFDTKRKRLVLFRQKTNASDGACRCTFEFYRPLINVEADGLTDPVPVQPVRCGQKTIFLAHLHGVSGEPVSPYTIAGALQDPAAGSLNSSKGGTNLNGGVSFNYQAPETPGTDTLELSCSYTDDEMESA
jgi:hypothetical protein